MKDGNHNIMYSNHNVLAAWSWYLTEHARTHARTLTCCCCCCYCCYCCYYCYRRVVCKVKERIAGIAASIGIPNTEFMPAILNRSLDMATRVAWKYAAGSRYERVCTPTRCAPISLPASPLLSSPSVTFPPSFCFALPCLAFSNAPPSSSTTSTVIDCPSRTAFDGSFAELLD